MKEEGPAAKVLPSESRPKEISTAFAHPQDVLSDPTMTGEQKRAALASWLSDSHAVPDAPALRRLENGATAHVDDILQALRSLDDDGHCTTTSEKGLLVQSPMTRRRMKLLTKRHWLTAWRFPWDDDEDPPPSPALAAYPVRLHFVQVSGHRMPQAA